MPSDARKRKNARDKRRRLKRKRIAITVLVIFIALIGFGAFQLNNMFGQMDQVDLDETDLGIDENHEDSANLPNTDIINIALFGIDTRDNDYSNTRSDTIMIASIDLEHKKLKLSSIMRDSYVSIPDHGYNKLNSAYAYGGPSLAIKALNTNLDMNITDFVSVNFEAMEKIVDSVGGVEIDVATNELSVLNRYISELNRLLDGSSAEITSGGLQTLDGRQAVAYSRIRYVGNGDYQRTERQRTVLEQVLNKVLKSGSITQAMKFADSLLPYIQTSLTRSEILSLGTKVLTSGTTNLVDTRIPTDDFVKNTYVETASVVLPSTLLDNVEYLHNFIYENDDYEPSERLLEINNTIKSYE